VKMKSQLVLALALVSIGVIGLIAVGCQTQSVTPFNNPQGFGFPNGMMGPGMMGGGMMGGRGYGYAPRVNATPVPATQAVDREIKIVAHNFQFDPARVVVKKGETVKFVIANQDVIPHNLVSANGKIAYTFLPANATASVVWVASEKGNYVALCTFHPGMQMQIVVE